MSNPQWNSFQSHLLNSSDTSILRYKSSLSMPSKNLPATGSAYGMQSASMSSYNFPSVQAKRPNGLLSNTDNGYATNKFDSVSYDKSPIGNFPPIGVFSADLFNEKTNVGMNSNRNPFNMSSGDTSNNQGTRETGIIEKLLVRSRRIQKQHLLNQPCTQ